MRGQDVVAHWLQLQIVAGTLMERMAFVRHAVEQDIKNFVGVVDTGTSTARQIPDSGKMWEIQEGLP